MWINLMSYISPLLIQETETIKYNFLVDSDIILLVDLIKTTTTTKTF